MKKSKKSELRSVLEEEVRRLRDLSVFYEKEINSLPKGYISVKKINEHKYAYLSFRDKVKIRSKYVGKSPSDKVNEIKRKIESRKEYEFKLKVVKEKLKELRRLLKIGKI